MKREVCGHCGSECVIGDYTAEALRARILKHVASYNSRPDDMIVALAKEGFRAIDVKLQATHLWNEGKLELQQHGSWIAKVIVA